MLISVRFRTRRAEAISFRVLEAAYGPCAGIPSCVLASVRQPGCFNVCGIPIAPRRTDVICLLPCLAPGASSGRGIHREPGARPGAAHLARCLTDMRALSHWVAKRSRRPSCHIVPPPFRPTSRGPPMALGWCEGVGEDRGAVVCCTAPWDGSGRRPPRHERAPNNCLNRRTNKPV